MRTNWSNLFAPAERTLPAMLKRQAERYGQRPLVSAGDTTWSYADAHAAAAQFAGTLRGAGVTAGDRVAVMCSNRIEFLQIVLGCAWLGAVAVPINTASRGPQLQHILSNCGARLLVSEAAYAENLTLSIRTNSTIDAIWLIGGDEAEVRLGRIVAIAMPPGGEPIEAAAGEPAILR